MKVHFGNYLTVALESVSNTGPVKSNGVNLLYNIHVRSVPIISVRIFLVLYIHHCQMFSHPFGLISVSAQAMVRIG